jgi:hypothetical protein
VLARPGLGEQPCAHMVCAWGPHTPTRFGGERRSRLLQAEGLQAPVERAAAQTKPAGSGRPVPGHLP